MITLHSHYFCRPSPDKHCLGGILFVKKVFLLQGRLVEYSELDLQQCEMIYSLQQTTYFICIRFMSVYIKTDV